MRKTPFFRTSAGALAGVLFTVNAALAHAPEAAFWAERRRARDLRRAPGLAAFAAGLPAPAPLRMGPGTSFKAASSAALPPGFEREHAALFRALTADLGSVRRVALPVGAPASRLVVHIQDVHMNADAQRRIGRAVQALIGGPGAFRPGLVALEGAFAPLDVDGFRAFPDRRAVRTAADHLLGRDAISGPAHAALTGGPGDPPFIGVDDAPRHVANVRAYRRSAPEARQRRERLARARAELESRKASVFNPALLALDRQVQGHRGGKTPLGAHIRTLSAAGGPGASRVSPAGPWPDLALFLEALEMESALDLKRVEAERTRLVERLLRAAPVREIEELAVRSAAFRAGSLPYAAYYRGLAALCERSGVPLSRFPAMEAYVRYVLAADRVSTERLLEQAAACEKDRYARLARTPAEKELVAASDRLFLAAKLVDFSLTPGEWRAYAAARREDRDPSLASFEAFYEEAEARDRAMAANLLREMDVRRASSAVLVTGGFHAPGIEAALRGAGVAVVSFSPRIDKLDAAAGSAYLGVFSREKTPLEKLFTGPKLFLGGPPASRAALVREALLVLLLRRLGGLRDDATAAFKSMLPGVPAAKVRLSLSGSRKARAEVTRADGDGAVLELAAGADGTLDERQAPAPRPRLRRWSAVGISLLGAVQAAAHFLLPARGGAQDALSQLQDWWWAVIFPVVGPLMYFPTLFILGALFALTLHLVRTLWKAVSQASDAWSGEKEISPRDWHALGERLARATALSWGTLLASLSFGYSLTMFSPDGRFPTAERFWWMYLQDAGLILQLGMLAALVAAALHAAAFIIAVRDERNGPKGGGKGGGNPPGGFFKRTAIAFAGASSPRRRRTRPALPSGVILDRQAGTDLAVGPAVAGGGRSIPPAEGGERFPLFRMKEPWRGQPLAGQEAKNYKLNLLKVHEKVRFQNAVLLVDRILARFLQDGAGGNQGLEVLLTDAVNVLRTLDKPRLDQMNKQLRDTKVVVGRVLFSAAAIEGFERKFFGLNAGLEKAGLTPLEFRVLFVAALLYGLGRETGGQEGAVAAMEAEVAETLLELKGVSALPMAAKLCAVMEPEGFPAHLARAALYRLGPDARAAAEESLPAELRDAVWAEPVSVSLTLAAPLAEEAPAPPAAPPATASGDEAAAPAEVVTPALPGSGRMRREADAYESFMDVFGLRGPDAPFSPGVVHLAEALEEYRLALPQWGDDVGRAREVRGRLVVAYSWARDAVSSRIARKTTEEGRIKSGDLRKRKFGIPPEEVVLLLAEDAAWCEQEAARLRTALARIAKELETDPRAEEWRDRHAGLIGNPVHLRPSAYEAVLNDARFALARQLESRRESAGVTDAMLGARIGRIESGRDYGPGLVANLEHNHQKVPWQGYLRAFDALEDLRRDPSFIPVRSSPRSRANPSPPARLSPARAVVSVRSGGLDREQVARTALRQLSRLASRIDGKTADPGWEGPADKLPEAWERVQARLKVRAPPSDAVREMRHLSAFLAQHVDPADPLSRPGGLTGEMKTYAQADGALSSELAPTDRLAFYGRVALNLEAVLDGRKREAAAEPEFLAKLLVAGVAAAFLVIFGKELLGSRAGIAFMGGAAGSLAVLHGVGWRQALFFAAMQAGIFFLFPAAPRWVSLALSLVGGGVALISRLRFPRRVDEAVAQMEMWVEENFPKSERLPMDMSDTVQTLRTLAGFGAAGLLKLSPLELLPLAHAGLSSPTAAQDLPGRIDGDKIEAWSGALEELMARRLRLEMARGLYAPRRSDVELDGLLLPTVFRAWSPAGPKDAIPNLASRLSYIYLSESKDFHPYLSRRAFQQVRPAEMLRLPNRLFRHVSGDEPESPEAAPQPRPRPRARRNSREGAVLLSAGALVASFGLSLLVLGMARLGGKRKKRGPKASDRFQEGVRRISARVREIRDLTDAVVLPLEFLGGRMSRQSKEFVDLQRTVLEPLSLAAPAFIALFDALSKVPEDLRGEAFNQVREELLSLERWARSVSFVSGSTHGVFGPWIKGSREGFTWELFKKTAEEELPSYRWSAGPLQSPARVFGSEEEKSAYFERARIAVRSIQHDPWNDVNFYLNGIMGTKEIRSLPSWEKLEGLRRRISLLNPLRRRSLAYSERELSDFAVALGILEEILSKEIPGGFPWLDQTWTAPLLRMVRSRKAFVDGDLSGRESRFDLGEAFREAAGRVRWVPSSAFSPEGLDGTEVSGDREHVVALMATLITNSAQLRKRDFSGARFRISARLVSGPGTGRVTVEVEDNVGGFSDPALLEKDAGGRPRAALLDVSGKEEGTGLGLAQAWWIARLHGGVLGLRNALGADGKISGAVVSFSLEMAPAGPGDGESGTGSSPASESGAAMKALLEGRPVPEGAARRLVPVESLRLKAMDRDGIIRMRLAESLPSLLEGPAGREAFFKALGVRPSAAQAFASLAGTEVGKKQVLVQLVGPGEDSFREAQALAALVAGLRDPGLKLMLAARDGETSARLRELAGDSVWVEGGRKPDWLSEGAAYSLRRTKDVDDASAEAIIAALPLPRGARELLLALLRSLPSAAAVGFRTLLEAARAAAQAA